MSKALLRKIFGTKNSRELKRMGKVVVQINALEPQFNSLSADELKNTTEKLRQRLDEGAELDSLLPEAFAAVRESALRSKQLRAFDVQLVGGITLHEGRIAEMRTGEGKTLAATLPHTSTLCRDEVSTSLPSTIILPDVMQTGWDRSMRRWD